MKLLEGRFKMFNSLKRNCGYSLVEVMVAMVGLSIVVLLLGTVVQTSIKTNSATRENDYALAAAKAKLNELISSEIMLSDCESGYDKDKEKDYYKAPNGKRYQRKWEISDCRAEPSNGAKPPIRVTVYTIAPEGSDNSGDTVITISSYIDPQNVCDENVKNPQMPIVKRDGSDKSHNTQIDIAVTFDGNNIVNYIKEILLISVSPAPSDYNIAKNLIIDGQDKNKVYAEGNDIYMVKTEISKITKNSSLKFNVFYDNCNKQNGTLFNVDIKFVDDNNGGGGGCNVSAFNGSIDEVCRSNPDNSNKVIGTIENTQGKSAQLASYTDKEGNQVTINNNSWNGNDVYPFILDYNVIKVKSGGYKFDYETTSSYNFTFKVDGCDNQYSGTINVNDLNEPATDITFSSVNDNVTEDQNSFNTFNARGNIENGTEILTLTFNDPDTKPDFLKYTYTLNITKNNVWFSPDNFEIIEKDNSITNVKVLKNVNELNTGTYNLKIDAIVRLNHNSSCGSNQITKSVVIEIKD